MEKGSGSPWFWASKIAFTAAAGGEMRGSLNKFWGLFTADVVGNSAILGGCGGGGGPAFAAISADVLELLLARNVFKSSGLALDAFSWHPTIVSWFNSAFKGSTLARLNLDFLNIFLN